MKKKSIIAILLLIMLFLINGCTSPRNDSSTAEKEGLSLSVTYGYDKCVKFGRYMSIKASISNQGEDFVGEFQSILPTNDNNHIMYQKDVKAPAGETVEVTFIVPVNTSYHVIDFNLVDSDGVVLISKTSKLDIIGGVDKILIGVLTDDYQSVNYLSNDNTKVFFLEKDHIPEEALGYDTLDALVINNYNTDLLTDQQYEAIKKFVNNGGTLVLGTGVTADKTLKKFNDDFIALDKGTLIDVVNIFHSKTTKQVLSTKVEDSKELVYQEKTPLIWQVDKGDGNIQVIGFDIGLDTKDWSTIGTQVLGSITDHFSKTMMDRMQYEYKGYYNSYGIFNGLGVADDNNLPNVGIYVVILLIYVILIGPVLYLILRKKDKRNYTWILVPAISLLFAVMIYTIGSKTRMNDPYIGYVSIINVNKDMSATDNTYLSVTAPYNSSFGFSVDNKYQIGNITNDSGYYEAEDESKLDLSQYKTALQFNETTTDISLRNYAAFKSVYFKTNSSINIEGTYQSDLKYNDFKVSGEFTNQLGFDLSHAAIYSNNTIVNLGDIDNQETIAIGNQEQVTLASRDNVSGNKIIEDIAGGSAYKWNADSDIARRFYILDYYITNHFDSTQNSSYLIGFDYSRAEEGVVKDIGLKNSGVRLVVIPVDVDTTVDGKTYQSNIQNDMSVLSGEYNNNYNIILTNQLKVDYQFDTKDTILTLLYSKELNTEFLTDYWSGFYGTISAYNYGTNDYDKIFTGGQVGECSDLTNYINGDNVMSLLYEVDKTAQNKYSIVLPTISAIKEVR